VTSRLGTGKRLTLFYSVEILYCTYLEQQQTEKIETEVRVTLIGYVSRKRTLAVQGGLLGEGGGGVIRALQSDILNIWPTGLLSYMSSCISLLGKFQAG
jgi:hypothetical protein